MRIGMDLGGTKIEAAVLDDRGELLGRRRVPTPDDYPELLSSMVALVAGIEADLGPCRGVGVCAPGSISPRTGLVKNAHHMAIQDRPFDQDLTRVLGRPVRVANDAHCFALSEAVGGAGAGHKVVFGAILGTGVGGGLVVDGKLLVGANAISGEWGHNPLPWPREGENPGPRCDCGRHGCIETFFSGPGLARDHQAVTGQALGSADIAAGAARGDADCVATMERAYDRIARALGALISIVDPDVVVLGGGVSGIDALYVEVPKRWGAYVLSDHVDTRLVKHRFGDSSGVRGAAWLWD